MHIATISSKRQITLPKHMLEDLGLTAYGKVYVERDKGKLTIKPVKKSVVDETAGSLRKYVHPSLLGLSLKEIDKRAKIAREKYLAKKYKLTK